MREERGGRRKERERVREERGGRRKERERVREERGGEEERKGEGERGVWWGGGQIRRG